MTQCPGTSDTRERLHADLVNIIAEIDEKNMILEHNISPETLTQFVLDPTSMNLSNGYRLSTLHPRLPEPLESLVTGAL